MKHSAKELNVGVMGGLGSLTKEDEEAISDYLQTRNLRKSKGGYLPSSAKKLSLAEGKKRALKFIDKHFLSVQDKK